MSNQTPVQPQSIVVRDNMVPPARGRIVDYVLSQSDSPVSVGEIRPAVIVSIEHDGNCFLAVFTKGGADQMQPIHHVRAPHVEHDGLPVEGTWHWPPPRELVFKNVPVQAMPTPNESEPPSDAAPPDSQPAGLEAHIAKKGYPVSKNPFPIKETKE